MDWSKAKNILILIFILLNGVLFFTLNRFYVEYNISKEIIDNTVLALKNRNIIVKCDIPRYNSQTGTLSFNSNVLYKDKIIKKLLGDSNLSQNNLEKEDEIKAGYKSLTFLTNDSFIFEDTKLELNFNFADTNKLEKNIKNIVSEIGLPLTKYFIYEVKKNNDNSFSIILFEKYNEFIVYDNYIKLLIFPEKSLKLECKYRKTEQLNFKKKIIPAHQMLISNFSTSKEQITIISIDIGFKEYTMEVGTKELDYIPVWRVKLLDGSENFFKVYTGEVI